MRAAQIRRHLGALHAPLPRTGTFQGLMAGAKMLSAEALGPAPRSKAASLNLEFSPRDYVTYLLSIDAEIEHCLMVQYLYAAYSLGGPQVPEVYRDVVRNWQEVILGIAKEEMGHLISVQNSLRLIGAPLHMEREDYPWDVPFYPFPFALEPLTLDSLAKYVYAESPVDWDGGELGDEIRARVHAVTDDPHQVAELFNKLIPLVQDPDYLPDAVFQANTYPAQANWAEWGRGYQGGNRGNSSGQPRQTPDVLVVPQTCRDDMVSALQQIASQGEATTGDTKSHFVRFLNIYVEMRELLAKETLTDTIWSKARPKDFSVDGWKKLQPASKAGLLKAGAAFAPWSPSRKVAINPYVSLDPSQEPEDAGGKATRITHPESILWAQLHNVRYRMLLAYLIHSFTLFGGLNAAGAITPRGAIVNGTFGEMYNLRAVSEILMQLPVSATDPEAGFAGPPFQMPYTLSSPFGETNRWLGHLDLLIAADNLTEALLLIAPPARHTYLQAMREADKNMQALAQRILSGSIDTALF
ncbi:ferritin-like protein [Undibacterium sp. TS12]|uniref:ferritin-like protein n=1 Tax=Undibacterium sp. TS12 TaxID=2908202 RepID=UPI001F4D139D|nr:ferritin-like protein [Undibacterium sp. TS12]MCH8617720.1 ferritin-like protein [Undibacterium sp. TS12]